MAATTAGALKAYIESLGLGLSSYRDAAPSADDPNGRRIPAVPYPFTTVREGIAITPNRDGDLGDPAAFLTVRELLQVDLWQMWRDAAGKPAESYTLPGVLMQRLRGARLLPVGSSVVYGVTVTSSIRLLEEQSNIVHHAISCVAHRQA